MTLPKPQERGAGRGRRRGGARRGLGAACALLATVAACDHAEPDEGLYLAGRAPVYARELVLGLPTHFVDGDASRVAPLREYLLERIGIPVRIRIADGDHELPRLVSLGAIDAAQLPPLAYVRLREQHAEVVPLLTPMVAATPTSLGHVYVRDDSPVETLEDLEGRSLAYVSRESSAGYLFPRALLRQRGIDPERFFSRTEFPGSQEAVIEAVLSGKVDAGATSDLSLSAGYGMPTAPDGLRVVAKTARIPNDCLVVHTGYDAAGRTALLEALLALRPDSPAAQRVLAPLGVNGWVRADDRRYDVVRSIVAEESRLTPRGTGVGIGNGNGGAHPRQ